MDLDMEYLIQAINEANDNIWLGDFSRAKKIVESCLDEADQNDILALEDTAQGIRGKIYELRKIASKKKIRNSKSWVLTQVSEELAKKEIDPVKSIAGVCVIYLLGLKEIISLLGKPNLQKTLNDIGNNQNEERIVHKDKQGYRYSLERFADRWDARVILDKSVQSLDPSKIRKISDERNASLEDKSEGLRSSVFELYGRNMYAQIVGLNKYIEVSIRVPRSEDEEGKVSRFVEIILDALV